MPLVSSVASLGGAPPMLPILSFDTHALNESEEAAHKARLRSGLKKFMKRALRGSSCVLLKEQRSKRYPAKLFIDMNLEYLVVKSVCGTETVCCTLSTIEDIYSIVDGLAVFPTTVLEMLTHPEEQSLLRIVFERNGSTCSFCMLDQFDEGTDLFLDSVKLLSVYARSRMGC